MADPTSNLPANVTLQLTRLRDGRLRLTAEATDWPARVELSTLVTYEVADELVGKLDGLHALETGAFV